MRHYDQNKILTDNQHGFRKRRSCETQLIATVHEIVKGMADGTQVDVVLLDFSKAFDKVPHERLLRKLDFYGIRGTTLEWIGNFLKGRNQRVVLEGAHSEMAEVLSGVPQGTVLGPLLFLTYINDLPEVIKHSSTKLFADDSGVLKKIKNKKDQEKLQEDLRALEQWESDWLMEFNPSKCSVMNMREQKKDPLLFDYKLHGQVLEKTRTNKYLGVHLSNTMEWTTHIEHTAAKGHRTVGFLRRNFSSCSTEAKAATYTTMVRPILEYASVVWDPTLKKDIDQLEKVQRVAARYAKNNYRREPGTVTSILSELAWQPLEERRMSARLQMLFKIHTGLVDLDNNAFYRQADSRTRGNRLFQERTESLPQLHSSFFPRTLREWNKLPYQATSAPLLSTFRARAGL